jgi:glycosyltransferase involved in cell wall biosynthesis
MRVCVMIPTYERPLMLRAVLAALGREPHDLHIIVVDDASSRATRTSVREWLEFARLPVVYKSMPGHCGRERFYEVINQLWSYAQRVPADYYVMLQDDITLEPDMLSQAISVWESIDDPTKICLNLMLDKVREDQICWTGCLPERGAHYSRTQWVDGFYLAEKRFFNALSWRLDSVHPWRWRDVTLQSSGVGQQMSLRLHQAGYSMYRVPKTLVHHGNHPSLMHPAHRLVEPLYA